MDPKPWEIQPALTKDRLCELGRIIRDVRHGTLTLYDPGEGDGPWSLGCRVYERTINIIQRETEDLSWLDFHRSNGLYFVIYIEDVSIRFYKGSIDEPTVRTLRQRIPEIMGRQLEFPFYQSEWFWRIAVDIDEEGRVLRLVLAQLNGSGNSRYRWEIPILEPITRISPLQHTRSQGAILEKPLLFLRDGESGQGIVNGKEK